PHRRTSPLFPPPAATPTAPTATPPHHAPPISFRVSATNAVGDSAPSNTATATTPTAPAAPSSLAATAAASGTQVDLSWADNSTNETGFKVNPSTDRTSRAWCTPAGANATAYSWSGAAPGTTYSFRVSATNAVGDSAVSNTATVTTPAAPAAPSGLTATAAASGTQVDLSWADNSTNETGFKV